MVSDGTGPNDCEVCVSRHELTLVCTVTSDPTSAFHSIYTLSEP